jgi:hypothetical protein
LIACALRSLTFRNEAAAPYNRAVLSAEKAVSKLNIPIIPVTLFSLGIGFVMISNITFYVILGEVNGKRATHEQFGIFFVNFKAGRIVALHRQLYPESKKRKLMLLSFIIGIAVVIGTLAANADFVSEEQLKRLRESSTWTPKTVSSCVARVAHPLDFQVGDRRDVF